MSKASNTFMPFYVADYLADTSLLSRDQHGGYLLLIMAYWRNREPLPDDDDALAIATRSSPADWKKLRPILAKFFEVSDGVWRHRRIDKELAKADEKYAARLLASQKANAHRHGVRDGDRDGDRRGKRDGPRNGYRHGDRHGSQSESESDKNINVFGAGAAARGQGAAPRRASDWEASLPKWQQFRQKVGEGVWLSWFDECRPNGSERTILAPTAFAAEQLRYRYATVLEDHFGSEIEIKFDPEKWAKDTATRTASGQQTERVK